MVRENFGGAVKIFKLYRLSDDPFQVTLKGILISILPILLLIGLVPPFAFAGIAESECGSFDYSSHFGPVRDQEQRGLCWAFATAGLFEEELCIRDPSTCGKTTLAPMDVARAHFKFSGGYNERPAVETIVASGGVCPEAFAPYRKFNSEDYNKEMEKRYTKLADKYNELSCPTEFDQFSSQEPSLRCMHKIIKMLSAHTRKGNEDALEKKLFESVKSKEAPELVLADLLISKECVAHRIHFDNIVPSVFYISTGEPPAGRLSKLIGVFQSGRSVSIGVCAERYLKVSPSPDKFEQYLRRLGATIATTLHIKTKPKQPKIEPKPECGSHALIANGLRWNKSLNRCEIQLKNSWGEHAPLHGWTSADQLLPFLEEGVYLQH